jgi:hypothetical protein
MASGTFHVKELGRADPWVFGAVDRMTLKEALAQLPYGYKRIFLLHEVLVMVNSRPEGSLETL